MTNFREKALDLAFGIELSEDFPNLQKGTQAQLLGVCAITYALCYIGDEIKSARETKTRKGIPEDF